MEGRKILQRRDVAMIEVWDEIAAMQRRMDDVVREFLGPRARPSYPALPLFLRRPFLPATDVFARGEDVVVRIELPGIDPEKDVTVSFDEGELVIRGERRRREELKDEDYYRMEADYGTFLRRIPLPEGIDGGKIVAQYVDGILEIRVPKAAKIEAPKEKVIPVHTVARKAEKAA
jgi:HSP20 family protein